ncbi:PREDICTED: LOW QUALITY PROTEIN: serine/threonine-protein phosphatase 1 regulatory subunit 10 [Sturnus vulgaris]|uniref:LOW QUALITY PROTEIN: serine/threonine-protein phosphatase 1 regulatory subunit 10 n=1 Tax=Sturnus vulgaris TaxID=9172 RepID=UPI00071A2772|nr:PREDICTED: LOW QUALITY PROTEIN: serine/threonine-protein phosphatase 1 regulatory subunit 10 [Sturnus vulgaris]
MGSGPIDPKELLKGLDCFLGRDGEVKTMDGISKIFSLMKDSQKMVSRCIYLNILLQTRAHDPGQNNTAKLVKQLSKSSDDEELRRLASILVSDWMGVIRSQSSSQPTAMEGLGFLDALNSAPVPGIKIKKKKKVLSPTAAKPSPFEGKPTPEPSTAKPSSPEPAAAEPMDTERPGTPVPAIEVPEPMDTGSSETGGDPKSSDVPSEGGPAPRRPRKKKSVSWPEEGRLREYFYFELDETERVNVNKIKDFGEAAKREMLKDRHAFETARRLSHDSMEEKVPWAYPKALELPAPLVIPGSGSRERFTQAERVKGILQEIFLSKESIPDSPHEPDPESYEPLPPKLIPLDEDCSGEDGAYPEGLDPGNSAASPEPGAGAKLPPVLANLMGSVGAGKGPPGPPQNAPINMQEILSSIMVTPPKSGDPKIRDVGGWGIGGTPIMGIPKFQGFPTVGSPKITGGF